MSRLNNNQYLNVNTTSAIAPVGGASDAVSSSQAPSGEAVVMHHREPVPNANTVSSAGAQDIVRPASPSQSSSTGASASGHNESSAHSASLSHAGSSSGSRAEPARAAPGPVELSDAVQEFLAKPVSGPYRPIFFDLETTGKQLLCCWTAYRAQRQLTLLAQPWLCLVGCVHHDSPTHDTSVPHT